MTNGMSVILHGVGGGEGRKAVYLSLHSAQKKDGPNPAV